VRQWAVIDTNVLISGIYSAGTGSPPQVILDAMLAGKVRFLVSEELVFEYRRVLLEPRARSRHGLPEAEIDDLLAALLQNAAVRNPAARGPHTVGGLNDDPPPAVAGDEHVIALLSAEPRAVLVTGDRLLAKSVGAWRLVFTPADHAALFGPAVADIHE
jgi:uncharacterized protein